MINDILAWSLLYNINTNSNNDDIIKNKRLLSFLKYIFNIVFTLTNTYLKPIIYNEHSDSQKKFLNWYLGLNMSDMIISYQSSLNDLFIHYLFRNMAILYNIQTKRNGGLPIIFILLGELSKVSIHTTDTLQSNIIRLLYHFVIRVIYMPYIYLTLDKRQYFKHNDNVVYSSIGSILYCINVYWFVKKILSLKK